MECLEQNIRKKIDGKRPSSKKQMKRVQNIHTKTCNKKYNQVKLALAVFVSTKLALNYIKHARCIY